MTNYKPKTYIKILGVLGMALLIVLIVVSVSHQRLAEELEQAKATQYRLELDLEYAVNRPIAPKLQPRKIQYPQGYI